MLEIAIFAFKYSQLPTLTKRWDYPANNAKHHKPVLPHCPLMPIPLSLTINQFKNQQDTLHSPPPLKLEGVSEWDANFF